MDDDKKILYYKGVDLLLFKDRFMHTGNIQSFIKAAGYKDYEELLFNEMITGLNKATTLHTYGNKLYVNGMEFDDYFDTTELSDENKKTYEKLKRLIHTKYFPLIAESLSQLYTASETKQPYDPDTYSFNQFITEKGLAESLFNTKATSVDAIELEKQNKLIRAYGLYLEELDKLKIDRPKISVGDLYSDDSFTRNMAWSEIGGISLDINLLDKFLNFDFTSFPTHANKSKDYEKGNPMVEAITSNIDNISLTYNPNDSKTLGKIQHLINYMYNNAIFAKDFGELRIKVDPNTGVASYDIIPKKAKGGTLFLQTGDKFKLTGSGKLDKEEAGVVLSGSGEEDKIIPKDADFNTKPLKSNLLHDGLFSFARLLASELTNKKILREANKETPFVVPNPPEEVAILKTDYKPLQQANVEAGKLRASQKETPYAEINLALNLETNKNIAELRRKADVISDLTTKESELKVNKANEQNNKARYAALMSNLENIYKTEANKRAYKMAGLAKSHSNYDIFAQEMLKNYKNWMDYKQLLEQKSFLDLIARTAKVSPYNLIDMTESEFEIWNKGERNSESLTSEELQIYKKLQSKVSNAVRKYLVDYLGLNTKRYFDAIEAGYDRLPLDTSLDVDWVPSHKDGGKMKERLAKAKLFYKSIKDLLDRSERSLDRLFECLYKLK